MALMCPDQNQYNDALQNTTRCFSDPDLAGGKVRISPTLRIPMPCSGNFASVYHVTDAAGNAWAVKCFTRDFTGLQNRYRAISSHLHKHKLPFMIPFAYIEKGIQVKNRWYPIVKMRWVEGDTLGKFVLSSLDKPQRLLDLAALWVKLARELRDAQIAHGDLQHGNVLLVPGNKPGSLAPKLVDYDGMCVPDLLRVPTNEVGHPSYQHPSRLIEQKYDAEIDRFANLVIYTALNALAVDRTLWDEFSDEDNILFRSTDFQDPDKSKVFHRLWNLPEPSVHAMTGHLLLAATGGWPEIPLLQDLATAQGPVPLTSDQERHVVAIILGRAQVSVPTASPAPAPAPMQTVGGAKNGKEPWYRQPGAQGDSLTGAKPVEPVAKKGDDLPWVTSARPISQDVNNTVKTASPASQTQGSAKPSVRPAAPPPTANSKKPVAPQEPVQVVVRPVHANRSPSGLPLKPRSLLAPALCLLGLGFLNLLGIALSGWIFLFPSGPSGPMMTLEQFQIKFADMNFVLFSFLPVLILALSGIVLVGAACQMLSRRAYAFVVFAAVLAILPVTMPVCFLGVPVGIWVLEVLFQPEVRATFESKI